MMKNFMYQTRALFISLLSLCMLLALAPNQSMAQPRRGGLYGDWQVKYEINDRQMESIIAFSRDSDGNLTGQWISAFSLRELKNVQFENGQLNFEFERRNRDGQTTVSKFTGTVSDGALSGKMASSFGEYSLEGHPMERISRAVGNWNIAFTVGDREIKSTLVINMDKEGEISVQWPSDRVKHEISDAAYQRGSLTFKVKSSMEDRQWESTFEGTLRGNNLSGTLKSEQGELSVEGERENAALIGNWSLEIETGQGNREQRLKVNPDMSGLYGSAPIEKVNFEDGKVSFKNILKFGDREFEMSFEGTLAETELTGTLTNSRGEQKVIGKKIIRTRGFRNN
ncbi:hypothetical protein K8I31_17600 [bacterium]|nr:hypothetical protein [bacterium]